MVHMIYVIYMLYIRYVWCICDDACDIHVTLCNPMDYSLPGSSVHGILQARILKWLTIPFSRGSSQSRDQSQVFGIAGRFFIVWATWEAKDIYDISITYVCVCVCVYIYQFSSLSSVQTFVTPWTTVCQASLSITNSRSLPEPTSIESVKPSNYLILCHPLLLPPSIFPSIRIFSNESALHIRWPKYWSFSFKISPSNEHPGLISFRIDWLDLLAVQGTLKSLLQQHSSKASNICQKTTQKGFQQNRFDGKNCLHMCYRAERAKR